MPKVLPASCENNVVTIESQNISVSDILSQGVKASTGVALVQGDAVTYITSNASDIKDLITTLVSILSAIDATTNAPGANSSAIASLNASKDNLK